MRLFILFIYIIANVSNNSRASLESFLPSNDVLLSDTTKSSDKSCSRPCKFNVRPRRCRYDFEIKPTFGEDDRPALTINGQTPGPPIHVCLHDIIVVKVKNKIPNQDITMHWHGIEQKGTPYMDGVPMITQCPISYGSVYEYSFAASSPGTFFYHADSVLHHSDGVYGTLIVDQPQPLEPHASLYDYDRSDEHTLIVGARFPELLTARLEDTSYVPPDGIIINRNEDYSKIFVIPGYGYRLRLINAIALECPLVIQAYRHAATVIATDGKPVQPVTTAAVKIYPGERMDVVIRADQESGGYWVRVSGEGLCKGLNTYAMLLYSGFNYTSMLLDGPDADTEFVLEDKEAISGQALHSSRDVPAVDNIKSIYLKIDRSHLRVKDDDIDFRYLSDAVPHKPFFPAALSLRDDVVQINGKNFLYPTAPYLLKRREVPQQTVCIVGEEENNKQPQCMLILNVNLNEVVELVLANEGHRSNDTYTFHMHGYGMQVVTTWQNPGNTPISKEDFHRLEREGLITRNVKNPPVKDTVVVPNKGVTIVRFTSTFGGSWLLECRSCSFSLPVAILINVPLSIPKLVTDSLPSCGSYKPADVLLN
ncbi:L-ascorbate oxidase-like [Melitaea cinxia]|uniref:L-ascorbate oxidase-like n=1 Tax=Melitaea cinxia TaxID=113334 RepID=UPI001E26F3A5|nr:L-ascorbate oxidase-like [Melitaea cinxia]